MKRLFYALTVIILFAGCSKEEDNQIVIEQYKRDIVGYWVQFSQTDADDKTYISDTTYSYMTRYLYFSQKGKLYICADFLTDIESPNGIWGKNYIPRGDFSFYKKNENIMLTSNDLVGPVIFTGDGEFEIVNELDIPSRTLKFIRKDWVTSLFPIPED